MPAASGGLGKEARVAGSNEIHQQGTTAENLLTKEVHTDGSSDRAGPVQFWCLERTVQRNGVLTHAATWMNLENIMLRERDQSSKTTNMSRIETASCRK